MCWACGTTEHCTFFNKQAKEGRAAVLPASYFSKRVCQHTQSFLLIFGSVQSLQQLVALERQQPRRRVFPGTSSSDELRVTQMAERSPIFSKKSGSQKIGYIEDGEAFDLLGNKRCNYCPSTGNLLELDSGRTIGHVSLAGHFVGASWIADELFPPPNDGTNPAPTTSHDEPAESHATEATLSRDAERALEMVRTTLAMKPVNTKHQTANDVAARMREHLAGLRKQRPRARVRSLA